MTGNIVTGTALRSTLVDHIQAGLRACRMTDRKSVRVRHLPVSSSQWYLPGPACLPLRGQRRTRTDFPFHPTSLLVRHLLRAG
jgi:hypothetical protein